MRLTAIFVLLVVFAGTVGAWSLANRPVSEQPWIGDIKGVSFNPYHADQDPWGGRRLIAEDIRSDIEVLAGSVRGIRTYTTLNGWELIPEIAEEFGLDVTLGAWLQGIEADEQEIANLIRLTNEFRSVKRVLVGNESILRDDISVEQMIAAIRRVKREVRVPVSTAEPWHVWLDNPELTEAADYIAVHLLPYWEGIPIDEAITFSMNRYHELRSRFPNKPVVITEIGWPSSGPWLWGAEPSQVNQARFLRTFLNLAAAQGIDYYIMEAFDQHWKREIEGTVGASWGIWDAFRQPKFPMTEPIHETPNWPALCALALALAAVPSMWFAFRRRDLKPFGLLFFTALINAGASVLVWSAASTVTSGMWLTTEIVCMVLIGAQLLQLLVVLVDGSELTDVLWKHRLDRHFRPQTQRPPARPRKVSIHVPCYNEPPHMVMETLAALARLDYPDFEVLVIDNNTRDEAVWRPLEEECRKLGPRFRFFHLPQWPGYKAGALNFALAHTAPDAEVIAVIDSDYKVTPDWLSGTIPYFDDPKVGFVQSPQDYREWEGDGFKSMIQWEYAGFFHIGMIQRNEDNAIIQHGTMTQIRRDLLVGVGGWAEWCITEDAELGLRLFERGYEAVYMNHSFGKGLVPDSFTAYKTQRFRWAYGAVQILKRHWRELLPSANRLSFGQKYHFITGWMSWFADAAHMAFAGAAIVWSLGMVVLPFLEFPPMAFVIPTVCVFGFKLLACLWLYQARVRCRLVDNLGAAVAGMALTHTVGRAIWQGLFTSGRPFVRTPKCENQPKLIQGLAMAREEVGLMLSLWIAAAAVVYAFGSANREAVLWAITLLVQSIPYCAALMTSMVNIFPDFGLAMERRRRPVPATAEAVD